MFFGFGSSSSGSKKTSTSKLSIARENLKQARAALKAQRKWGAWSMFGESQVRMAKAAVESEKAFLKAERERKKKEKEALRGFRPPKNKF